MRGEGRRRGQVLCCDHQLRHDRQFDNAVSLLSIYHELSRADFYKVDTSANAPSL